MLYKSCWTPKTVPGRVPVWMESLRIVWAAVWPPVRAALASAWSRDGMGVAPAVAISGVLLTLAPAGSGPALASDPMFLRDANLTQYWDETQSGRVRFMANAGLVEGNNRVLVFRGMNGLCRDGNRVRVLSNLIFLLVTQPESGSGTSNAEIQAWLKGIGLAGPALGKAAVYLDRFKMNYWSATLRGADVHNFAAKHLRALNPRTVGGHPVGVHNLQKFSVAMAALPVALDVAEAALGAGLRVAIESDLALYRLDALEHALEGCSDPAVGRAIARVRDELRQSDSYYRSFIIELSNRRGELAAHTGTAALMIVAQAAGAHGMFVVGLTFQLIAAQIGQHEAAQLATMAATLEDHLVAVAEERAQRAQVCEVDKMTAYARFIHFDRMAAASSVLPEWVVGLLPRRNATRQVLDYFRESAAQYLSIYQAHAERACFPTAFVQGTADVALVLAIDSSGSMAGNDPQNIRLAVSRYVLDRLGQRGAAGVVDFDGEAKILAPVASGESGRRAARAAIDRIDSSGSTNIGAAVSEACRMLSGPLALQEKAVVLLTDGLGGYGGEASICTGAGARIYTIGLSDEAADDLLFEIAHATGGQYFKARDASRLFEAFAYSFIDLSGESIVLIEQGHIVPGGVREIPFFVDTHVRDLTPTLYWVGSDLDLELIAPDGSMAHGERTAEGTYEFVRLEYPQVGQWLARVRAIDVPPEGEPFRLVVSGDVGDTRLRPVGVDEALPLGEVALIGVVLEGELGALSSPRGTLHVEAPGGGRSVVNLRSRQSNERPALLAEIPWLHRPGDYGLRFVVTGRQDGRPVSRELVRTLRVTEQRLPEERRLLRQLARGDHAERARAAQRLGELRWKPAVAQLREALGDGSAEVRAAAAWALERIETGQK